MNHFSIAGTISLRNNYANYRFLSVKSNRNDASTNQLNYADSLALRRAVKKLEGYNFSEASESDLEEKVRAFVDTYNYALESTEASTNASIRSAYKKLKNLSKEYSSELENIGIKADASGYLTMSSSAASNISGTRFSKLLGKDSEFMNRINKYAKQVSNSVDIYV